MPQWQRMNRGLGATAHNNIGAPGADHLQAVRDGLGARRAGADRRVDAGPSLQVEADRGRRTVRHQHRHGVRRDPARALLAQHVVLVEQRGDTTDAGGEHDAETLFLDVRLARLCPRFARRDDGELLRAVERARLDAIENVERFNFDAGRDANR